MIDTVVFQNDYGDLLLPYEDFGLIMITHEISPPEPKVYRVNLDGADGDIDMTEWAGDVKYNTRTVSIAFRDMQETVYRHLLNFLLGRRVKIMFSEDPEFYFYGRCEYPDMTRESRVSDVTLDFVCEPYRMRHFETSQTITSSGTLTAERMPACPTITASASCNITIGGATYALASGSQTIKSIIIRDRPQTVTVSNSASVNFTWRDGVF